MKPPRTKQQRQSREIGKSLVDIVLENESEEIKRKISDVLRLSKIGENDPMFAALLALTHCRVIVTPIPERLEELESRLQSLCNQIEDHLQTHQSVSLDFHVVGEQVSNLLRKKVLQPSPQSFNSNVSTTPWIFALGIAVGVLLALFCGLVTSRYQEKLQLGDLPQGHSIEQCQQPQSY